MYLITKVVSGKADGRINDVFRGSDDLRRAIDVIERDIDQNNKDNALNYSYVFFDENADNHDGWFVIESGHTIGKAEIRGKGRVYEMIVTALKNVLVKDPHLDHIWNDSDDDDIYICDNGYRIDCDGQNLYGVVSMIRYALSYVSDEEDYYIYRDWEDNSGDSEILRAGGWENWSCGYDPMFFRSQKDAREYLDSIMEKDQRVEDYPESFIYIIGRWHHPEEAACGTYHGLAKEDDSNAWH